MKLFLPLLIFLTFSFSCFSQAFQVNLQGQKQQAMGSAGNALVQDGSILFFNPGGMSFLNSNTTILSGNATIGNTAFQDASTQVISRTQSPVGTPFAVYTVFSVKDSSRLKLGVGVYTPFGSAISWEEDWTGRFALRSIKLQSIFFQPTLSYRLTDNFSFGAGFVYSSGSVQLKKDLPVQDQNGNYGNATLEGKASGMGFNAGVLFKPNEKLSFGLSYRSGINMQVKKGTATFSVPSSLAPNFPNGNFTATLPLPSVFTFGFSYLPSSKLSFVLDVNYGGWKSYEALEFDYENNTSSLTDTYSARNYKNNFAFRSGMQFQKDEKTFLRAGLGYVLSPVPDGFVTPETPDANRINYTAGIGKKLGKNFTIDASLTFANPKRKDKNLETNLDGHYKTLVFIPGLSLEYSF
jgi:long-chain fatty acid transport protein